MRCLKNNLHYFSLIATFNLVLPQKPARILIWKKYSRWWTQISQAARMTKEGFFKVLEKICSNPVVHQGGIQPQLPMAHQPTLTLECLGPNSNGTSLGQYSHSLNVWWGILIKVTLRVLKDIKSLPEFFVCPDARIARINTLWTLRLYVIATST